MKRVMKEMSAKCWFLDATQMSLEMGNTILKNMVMIGALTQTGIVNLTKLYIEGMIKETFPDDVAQTDIAALTRGMQAVESR